MSTPYTSRWYSCASLILLQLHKLDGCTLRRMAYSSAAMQHALQWFPLLCGVSSTGIPQPVDRLSLQQAHSLPHSAVHWCNASGQLFSICIVCKFTFGALHLHKCWITLCWYTKYLSKDNLPLPLLARKRDTRQSDDETKDKVAVGQS